jgi:armadillo repeat-containing protein 8
LNAVWALKHLVHSAPSQLKKRCVRELGPGWLKQIICNGADDDSHDTHRNFNDLGTHLGMGTPNASGEQVDLLNSMEISNQDTSYNGGDEMHMTDSVGPLSRHERFRGRFSTGYETQSRSSDLYTDRKDDEHGYAVQAAKDDLAVQEQGLGLVSNLICGPDGSDMVDYLFTELGQDKLFGMLTNLLKPKTVDSFNSRDRRSGGVPTMQVPPPTEIVMGVCFILVHLAGSQPKHRQLLIAQTELLRLMVPLFTHPHCSVRVTCVWTVINLTWIDDASDKLQSRNRAHELRKLGILSKLQELENDQELDVKERTKVAVCQMNELLR